MAGEDGTLMEGETGGIMDGAADEAANLLAEMAAAGTQAPGEGQGPESPTGTGAQGEGASGEPTPGSNEAGGEAEGGEAGETKPPPYDQDPKWKAARAAEAELNSILEEHGYLTPDELKEALKQSEGEDIEQLRLDAEAYRTMKAQQDADKLAEQEAGETPEETIERLRDENTQLKQSAAEQADVERALAEGRAAIERYESAATALVDKLDLPGKPERDLALQLLGVGNPMDKVDLDDRKAVVGALREQVPNVRKIIQNIQQRAVDTYAAGKSKLTPGKRAQEEGARNTPPATPAPEKSGKEPPTDVVTDPSNEFQDISAEFAAELLNVAGELATTSG